MISIFHCLCILDFDRSDQLIQVDHDGNCQCRLSCGNRNDKHREKNALKVFRKQIFVNHDKIEALRINSIDSNMVIRFFRVRNPYIPIKNMIEVKVKISYMLIPCII